MVNLSGQGLALTYLAGIALLAFLYSRVVKLSWREPDAGYMQSDNLSSPPSHRKGLGYSGS
jgi:hypothetical protein